MPPLAQHATDAYPFQFSAHPEVWLVVLAVLALGAYAAMVLGPKVVPPGVKPVNGRQVCWFLAGAVLLWFALDWPLHDLAENNLVSLHMVQHLVLSFLVPPCFWLATPEWLARFVIRDGSRAYEVLKRLASPVVAGVAFSTVTVLSSWPIAMNAAVRTAPLHDGMHLVAVLTALLLWIPVCGPWRELRLSVPGQMVYLFLISLILSVPTAWLGMANTPIYEVYDHGPHLFGMSAVEDQATAGVFVTLGGGSFLWAVIIVKFFKWAAEHERENKRNRLVVDPVSMQPVGMGFPDPGFPDPGFPDPSPSTPER
ncbi:MAG: cytochrome c oxidase assembly protein [Actinobacteria bacterium]|nr:cytochrome c oxidase assembly protein [Actinomycetota bacterium]